MQRRQSMRRRKRALTKLFRRYLVGWVAVSADEVEIRLPGRAGLAVFRRRSLPQLLALLGQLDRQAIESSEPSACVIEMQPAAASRRGAR